MKTLNRKKSAESQELSLAKKYDTIKLGIDWHAAYYKVVRIIDEGGPEPAQRFTPEQFLHWAESNSPWLPGCIAVTKPGWAVTCCGGS